MKTMIYGTEAPVVDTRVSGVVGASPGAMAQTLNVGPHSSNTASHLQPMVPERKGWTLPPLGITLMLVVSMVLLLASGGMALGELLGLF